MATGTSTETPTEIPTCLDFETNHPYRKTGEVNYQPKFCDDIPSMLKASSYAHVQSLRLGCSIPATVAALITSIDALDELCILIGPNCGSTRPLFPAMAMHAASLRTLSVQPHYPTWCDDAKLLRDRSFRQSRCLEGLGDKLWSPRQLDQLRSDFTRLEQLGIEVPVAQMEARLEDGPTPLLDRLQTFASLRRLKLFVPLRDWAYGQNEFADASRTSWAWDASRDAPPLVLDKCERVLRSIWEGFLSADGDMKLEELEICFLSHSCQDMGQAEPVKISVKLRQSNGKGREAIEFDQFWRNLISRYDKGWF